MEELKTASDVLFVLLGAIMVLAMHAGFAFLELGTVRKKNQVNALVKILSDLAVSTLAYFFIGYGIAYGVHFFVGADQLAQQNGYGLVKFFFLMTFAAAIPAIVSGGIAERSKFNPQLAATFMLVGFVYPFFEGIAWNGSYGIQDWLKATFGAGFHDFAGSVVVHAVGGWIGLAAVLLLGARRGRYTKEGRISAHPPSSIPFLALGAWILTVGWFGFNVMSAQTVGGISGLVAVNSLMAMVGGTLVALWAGKNDPGFVHNGPLAGLVAVCAGSDLMHPLGALVVGGVAGGLFVVMFTPLEDRRRVGRVAVARPVRRMGRHRRRHHRYAVAGRLGRRQFHVATDRHLVGHRDRLRRRLCGVRRDQETGRHPPRSGRGVQRCGLEHPQDHRDPGARVGLVVFARQSD